MASKAASVHGLNFLPTLFCRAPDIRLISTTLPFTQSPIHEGQENWLPNAAIFASTNQTTIIAIKPVCRTHVASKAASVRGLTLFCRAADGRLIVDFAGVAAVARIQVREYIEVCLRATSRF